MKLRVIIPITDTQFNESVREEVGSVAAPDVAVSYVNIAHGPASIESRYAELLASPGILARAEEAQREGIDGLFIDCFGEPGVSVVREKVDIPTVGGFEPAALTACLIARRFSVITVLQNVVPMIETLAKDLGVTSSLVSVREVDIPVSDLGDRKKLEEKLFEEAQRAIDQDGAEAIVLGCTGMLEVARSLGRLLKVKGKPAPVIDPTTAAITMLEGLVRNKLSQSRLTYFSPPKAKG